MATFTTILELGKFYFLEFRTYLLMALVVYFLFGNLWSRKKRLGNLPPGPWGLPLLGYLPFLSANEPHIQLEGLRKKYGDVFGLYMGSKYALFIGDLEKSKLAYNMNEFSGRPDGAFPISQKCTHFAAMNGQPWKERRKWTVQALRQLGVGTQMIQNSTREQIHIALGKLEKAISSGQNGDLNVRDVMTYATTTVVLKFVCGKTFPAEHHSYKSARRFLKFFAENASNLSLDVLIPWTKPFLYLMSQSNKESKEVFGEMETFMRKEVENHMENPRENPKDLIDYYLKQYQFEDSSKIPVNDISGDAQIMIFAGADTVRATVEWFLLCMAENPDIQEKVFHEIDDVLGPDGEVNYEDRAQLPYTEATILECIRYKILAPVNPYHSALQDTEFCGYSIPKDTLVFVLLWTLSVDPAHWRRPTEFCPDNFLNPEGTAVEIPEAFLPFSPGKRTCVGDKVALIESYLFCVSLMQRFQVLRPDSGLKMEGSLRVNVEPNHPVVKLVKRNF